MGTAICS